MILCFIRCTHVNDIYTYIYIPGWWFGTFYFPIYWECHHPNSRTHIFQRARAQPPTRLSAVYESGVKSIKITGEANARDEMPSSQVRFKRFKRLPGWWFGTFWNIFHNIWDNPSYWLSYFSEFKPPTSSLTKSSWDCSDWWDQISIFHLI